MDESLLEILACPKCRSPLRLDGAADGAAGEVLTGELVCTDGTGCGLVYPIREGIPVLLIDEARVPGTGA